MTTPEVSVVVPNYNHAAYLPRRIESILAQSHANLEILVLDDASTDDSIGVIQSYAARDRRIRVIPNQRNSGCTFVQWNKGVAAATGKYVWMAESDDYADPSFVSSLLSVLRSDTTCTVVYSQSWRIDAENRVLGTMADVWDPLLDRSHWQTDFVADGLQECARHMVWKNTIPNASAAVFRRESYLSAGGAPETMRLCGDWMAWVRLLRQGRVGYVAQPLNYFRQHETTVRAGTRWSRHLQEQWMVQGEILRTCPVDAATRRELAQLVVGQLLDQVLPAPRNERARLLGQYVSIASPILRGAPIAVGMVAARRLARSLRKRIRRTPPKSKN